MKKKFIFYEINEVPMLLIERYVGKFPRSSLSYIYQNSRKFKTLNDDSGSLSPWITWPTLHKGVNNDKHGISNLGQDLNQTNTDYPNFFNILASKGFTVGIFGVLHTYPLPHDVSKYSFYLPDVFAATPDAYPKKLKVFQGLNLRFTRKNARNVERAIPLNEIKLFVINFFQLGISVRTILEIIYQLIGELFKPTLVVKRRVFQAKLAFDVYLDLLNQKKPQISLFFSNHVASAMHRYWPATFPEDYDSFRMSEKWIRNYSGVIWDAMSEFDAHLQRIIKFIEKNDDYCLVILSSMGQAPVQDIEQINNELAIEDIHKFMRALGAADDSYTQLSAMVPRYIIRFKDEGEVNKFCHSVSKIEIRGLPIYSKLIDSLTIQISLGHENFSSSEFVKVNGVEFALSEIGLVAQEIQDQSGSYAYHVREGSLLIFNGKNIGIQDKIISTSRIAPSILSAFGVGIPDYMDKPLPIF